MAKDRRQVQDLPGPEQLTPEAHPVDTYHTPIVERPRPLNPDLHDVASALGDLQPSLFRFADKLVESDLETGRALAAKNQLDYKKAVDTGAIPAGANPWLVKGYKQQILQLQAQDYDSALRQAWTQSSVKESNDPLAFHSFVKTFTDTYTNKIDLKDDATYKQVFVPAAMRSQDNLQQEHTTYRQQETVRQASDATYRNIQGIIDNHYIYASPEALQQSIKTNLDSMVANGLPGAEANRIAVNAIRDKAIAEGDPNILNLGKTLSTNNGLLGKTQYGQEQFQEASMHIMQLQREKDNYEWSKHERAKQVAGEQGMIAAATRIGQDPTQDISDITSQLEKVDPEVAQKVRAYKDYVLTQNGKVYEDPKVLGELYDHIYKGTATAGEILDLANSKKLAPDQVSFAFRDMQQAREHLNLLDDPTFNRTVEELGSAIAGGDFIATPEDKAKALQAKNLLREGIIDFKQKNPNASKIDVFNYTVENQAKILKAFRPSDQNFVSPALQKAVVPKTAPAPKAPEAPAPRALYKSKDDLKAAIKEYNDTQGHGRLAAHAEALGLTVEEFIKQQSKIIK